jgi:exonuclease III
MRIATWNVNSIKQRMDNLAAWLVETAAGHRLPAGDQMRR